MCLIKSILILVKMSCSRFCLVCESSQDEVQSMHRFPTKLGQVPNYSIGVACLIYEGSFLYSRTRHEIKRLEQQQKCIVEYRLFAFEYKYYIVSITFLIHYKNINLVCLQNVFQQPL
jgi:hypothetical protein